MTVKTDLDRERIIALWAETFGDEESYINEFLDLIEKEGSFYGAFDEKGALLSMLFVLDLPIKLQKLSAKCAYMYACATRSDCRGKGVFSRLYEYVKTVAVNQGYDGIFCVPASEELFEFYKKLGFDKALYRRKVYAKNDGKKCGLDFEEKHRENAYAVYLNNLTKDICQPEKSINVFDLSLLASEAKMYAFDGGYLIYDGKTVGELVCNENRESILAEAARFFGKDLCAYTFPKENDREKYAVFCVLSGSDFPDNVYANMLMD